MQSAMEAEMPKRPYLNKLIEDLETLFDQNPSDASLASAILKELEHRSTQRAKQLKERIEAARGRQASTPTAKRAPRSPQKATDPLPAPAPTAVEPSPPAIATETPIPPTRQNKPRPPVQNKPEDALRAWTALEVLSPSSFRRETDLVGADKSLLAKFGKDGVPWEPEEKSRPGKRLFYEVYIGTIEMGPAVEALLSVYADKRAEKPSVKGASAIATVIVDKNGRPLEEETSATISSFAWGVPVALQGDLKRLADWTQQHGALLKEFRQQLILRDKDDQIVPLTRRHIERLYDFLVGKLNLQQLETNRPYFAVRRFEHFKSKTPPEPSLLNSFFLEDLAAASSLASQSRLPVALQHYLGDARPNHRIDLLNDTNGLKDLLQPALTPQGRWPAKGRFPLALLQQAAVNATNSQRLSTGVLAVNGPPGTGKTTLLRDVVAARLVDRAIVMCRYKNPADAFKPTRETFTRNGAKITLHQLDEQLKGYEMVVTSSNNKAVENVSAELPDIQAIAEDATGLRYFKTISDNVLQRKTWGLIAAVLGNSSNRYQFYQNFWKDEERGLSTYLNHACGIPQYVSEPQGEGVPPKQRFRQIVDLENPPSNGREALARWEKAQAAFMVAIRAFNERQFYLQKLYENLLLAPKLSSALVEAKGSLVAEQQQLESLRTQATAAEEGLVSPSKALTSYQGQRERAVTQRPGFFARLFRTSTYREWQDQISFLDKAIAETEEAVRVLTAKANNLRQQVEVSQRRLAETETKIARVEAELRQVKEAIAKERRNLSAPIPDESFFQGRHEDIQKGSVWFDKTATRMRDDVFEAAVLLHRAFIDAAADPLRQNLSIFVESFGTRSLGTAQKDALIPDLWSSFFLVVPVVSTTFASVNRMFSRLKPETLGWLLVDEAGQALPQAAVGAMMRAKRAVIVGDPLQIEPVVTLPSSLTEEICGQFGLDPIRFNAPEASTQTLADAASTYSARFPSGSGYRDVGAPLLVHRRCNSPMFDVSNEIAYSNLMVHAKSATPDNAVLGHSKWFDVVSQSGQTDKWYPDEGTVLIEKLSHLRRGGVDPDIYVVTPFVVVQDNLRKEILASGVLGDWVKEPKTWVEQRVGTVHTVQGREAEIVFFVLGAQAPSQRGARAWAGGNPNLVNVAVTRAKTSIYVIGNREAWKSASHFSTLSRFLPS